MAMKGLGEMYKGHYCEWSSRGKPVTGEPQGWNLRVPASWPGVGGESEAEQDS